MRANYSGFRPLARLQKTGYGGQSNGDGGPYTFGEWRVVDVDRETGAYQRVPASADAVRILP